MHGTCMMCGIKARLKHLNLYVIGSEGLNICTPCDMELVNFVREKIREYGIKRKEEFKKKRALRPVKYFERCW